MNDAAPLCVICPRALFDDEHGRYICRPCERRIDEDLLALAGPSGLYARLCLRIQPGRGSGGPIVSGTRGASMPPSEHVLTLTANGGIVSTLETWVADWATYGLGVVSTGGRLQHRVDQAVVTLRLNLTRAAALHPALDEFAREIRQARRQCEGHIGGEKPARRIPVACPCGHVIKTTIDTQGETCRGCGEQYGHTEVLRLPMAERRAAA
ncbi:hypothetical protein [Streptomyces lavendofoliae]|uniref:Uncharacterized protein n=1 Tax=Streptomyces lavendofoliae TaxID=67314 RepID=A0A918M5M2_9ACTN|nr:hypothetical protein [Streptomyces lavendofoliae]GGU52358.1 hypothetical protein GCM10010274_46590 [Streptomyces lavendofoliae]